MSSVIPAGPPQPYVAPWPSDFSRYSTRLYTLPTSDVTDVGYTVPAGQWVRVVYITAFFTTSANAGTRLILYRVLDLSNTVVLSISLPLAFVASSTCRAHAAPGAGSFTVVGGTNNNYAGTSVPDMIWPTGFRIQFSLGANLANDAVSLATLAYEMYVEASTTALIPAAPAALVPTTILT